MREEKLYNGITPKNDNLSVNSFGMRVHNTRSESMGAELHERLMKKLEQENK